MAYQIIGAAHAAGIATAPIKPTIVIGLGGTGKEVLLRLRRRFCESYGSLDEFPVAAYLHIDTDEAAPEQTGLSRSRDLLINLIDFKPSEKIFKPVNITGYIDNIDRLPHIKSWLNTTGETHALGSIMNKGAGHIRMIGRLGLFDYFGDIKNKLNAIQDTIQNPANINKMLDKHHITVLAGEVNVYIIASLAGGTGSSMFLDMAYIIRDMFGNNTSSVGFLIFPTVFAEDKDKNSANAYAALKELEHYNLENRFKVCWDGITSRDLPPGPFDFCYLIDGKNEKGLSGGSRADISQMIADNIFHDFSVGGFADRKRSTRIDLLSFLQAVYAEQIGAHTIGESFSLRYSSCGQAAISIPVGRIISACAYKLSMDLMDYFISSIVDESSIDRELQEEILPGLNMLEDFSDMGESTAKKHQLLHSLYTAKEGDCRNLASRYLDDLREKIMHETGAKCWSERIKEARVNFDKNFKDDSSPDRMGKYWSDMHNKKIDVIGRIIGDENEDKKGDLKIKIDALVDDQTRGIFYAIRMLEKLRRCLEEKYLPGLKKQINELEIKKVKDEKRMNESLIRLREDEKISILNPLKKLAVKNAISYHIDVLKAYYQDLIKIRSRQEAVEICQRILELVEKKEEPEKGKVVRSGILFDLNRATDGVGKIKAVLEEKYQFFKEKADNLFTLNIYREDDISKKYYPRYVNESDGLRVSDYADTFIKERELSGSADIIGRLKDVKNTAVIEESLISFSRKIFSKINNDYNVLDILYERGKDTADAHIEMIFKQAFPWVKGRQDPGGFNLPADARRYYIGIRQNTDDPNYERFKQTINNIAGGAPQFVDTGDGTKIIFYSEIAGFPVFYPETIAATFKESYSNRLAEGKDLHTDKSWFKYKEIMPLNAVEKAELKDAYRTFLLGVILDIFQVTAVGDNEMAVYTYSWNETLTRKRDEQLGIEMQAVRRLFEELKWLRVEIKREIDRRIGELTKFDRLAELEAIIEYYMEGVYPLTRIPIAGGGEKSVENDGYKIAREEAIKVAEMIPPEEKEKFVSKVKQLQNALSSFSRKIGDGAKRTLKYNELISKRKAV